MMGFAGLTKLLQHSVPLQKKSQPGFPVAANLKMPNISLCCGENLKHALFGGSARKGIWQGDCASGAHWNEKRSERVSRDQCPKMIRVFKFCTKWSLNSRNRSKVFAASSKASSRPHLSSALVAEWREHLSLILLFQSSIPCWSVFFCRKWRKSKAILFY